MHRTAHATTLALARRLQRASPSHNIPRDKPSSAVANTLKPWARTHILHRNCMTEAATTGAKKSTKIIALCGGIMAGYGAWHMRKGSLEKDEVEETAMDELLPDRKNRNLNDVYQVGERIGTGHFAVVYRGRHKVTGEEVAIKEIFKANTAAKALRTEVKILYEVGQHRNMVELKDVFETDHAWFVVMELVGGGELFERLVKKGAYSERQASRLMFQIADAISYLHTHGVCHRDLKPENLLLSSTEDSDELIIKICDFGLSVALEGSNAIQGGRQGTWAYWAPELFGYAEYGTAVDMWSVGVIMYILLSGRHPFDSHKSSESEVVNRIIAGDFNFDHKVWKNVSEEAKLLIGQLMQKDVSLRMTAFDLLENDWIRGHNVSDTPMPDSDKRMKKFNHGRQQWKVAAVSMMAKARNKDKTQANPTDHDAETLLKQAFKMFDSEEKGYISSTDLQKAMKKLGRDISDEEVKTMMEALDKDGGKDGLCLDFAGMMDMTNFMAPTQMSAGTTIFEKGDKSDLFYLITKGKVKVDLVFGEFKDQRMTQHLSVGDYFGTSALLSEDKESIRNGTAKALTDVEMISLSRCDFDALMATANRGISNAVSSSVAPVIAQPDATSPTAARSLQFVQMIASTVEQEAAPGELIYKEGEPGKHLFIIETGEVELSSNTLTRGGVSKTLSLRRPGECFGEHSLLRGSPHSVDARCTHPKGCKLVAVDKTDFLNLIKHSWNVHQDLKDLSSQHSKVLQRHASENPNKQKKDNEAT